MKRFGFGYDRFSNRENGTVVVKLWTGGFVGKAKCNPSDTFKFEEGEALALRRALGQWYGCEIAELKRKMDILWAERIEMEGALSHE